MADRPFLRLRWLVAGTIAGVVVGSMGIAVAQTDESTTTTAPSSSSTAPGEPTAPRDSGRRGGETLLTGEALEKARAAALAAVPGATIKKAETDADGAAYEVHLLRPDSTPATVKLDENFNVTSIEEGRAGGGCHHGPGGPGAVELTGETAEKVKAAALAAVPGATVDRMVEGRDGDGYVALITKSDGTRAAVKLDESFNVTSVEDKVGRPGGRGHRHGPPPSEDGTATQEDSGATPTNV